MDMSNVIACRTAGSVTDTRLGEVVAPSAVLVGGYAPDRCMVQVRSQSESGKRTIIASAILDLDQARQARALLDRWIAEKSDPVVDGNEVSDHRRGG